MKIVLLRYEDVPQGTRGMMNVVHLKGVRTFHSLEKRWKDNRPQESCIPEGIYDMIWEYSPSFKCNLWELKGVLNRTEIKIHPANLESQLKGCIALGKEKTTQGIGLSKKAMAEFHQILAPHQNEVLQIQIINLF